MHLMITMWKNVNWLGYLTTKNLHISLDTAVDIAPLSNQIANSNSRGGQVLYVSVLVAHVGNTRNAYIILVGKYQRKMSLVTNKSRWERRPY